MTKHKLLTKRCFFVQFSMLSRSHHFISTDYSKKNIIMLSKWQMANSNKCKLRKLISFEATNVNYVNWWYRLNISWATDDCFSRDSIFAKFHSFSRFTSNVDSTLIFFFTIQRIAAFIVWEWECERIVFVGISLSFLNKYDHC